MKKIRFFEYRGFEYDGRKESNLISDLPMTSAQLGYFLSLSESLIPDKQVFSVGAKSIQANSIVGMISFDGIQVEILPKLLRSQNGGSSIIKNLMFMLAYTNQLEVTDSNIGEMSKNFDSFIEAYISIFSNRLLNQLRKYGIPKAYILKEENQNTLKGRIVFPMHTSLNSFDRSRVYCEYGEFSENNNVSIAFKFVVSHLRKLTKNPLNLSALNRCYGLLDGVPLGYVRPEELDHVSQGKRDPNFIALLNLTKLFLRKMRPDLSGRKNTKVFSLLFDMNELFEEFIFQVLKRNMIELGVKEVSAQKKKKLVEKEIDLITGIEINRQLFDTFTDIIVSYYDGEQLIIDTKYKLISSKKNHYGVSNQDAYQVLAYKQIHSSNDVIPRVLLLYPKDIEIIKRSFKVTNSITIFSACTVDISCDLQTSLHKLIAELKEIIQNRTIAA